MKLLCKAYLACLHLTIEEKLMGWQEVAKYYSMNDEKMMLDLKYPKVLTMLANKSFPMKTVH